MKDNPDTSGDARREFAAFFHAVLEQYGPESAYRSAEAWLRKLAASSTIPASAREWRQLSIEAAALALVQSSD